MSDERVTYDVPPPADAPQPPRSRPGLLGQALEAVVVLVVFVAAGLGAGWLWEHWWTPKLGVVYDGEYYPGTRIVTGGINYDFPRQAHDFDAVATFLLIGLVAGLVLGVLAALLARRSELVTLGAVVVGSALACLVAYRLGVHLGPADPGPLVESAADGAVLPSNLTVQGMSPFVGWPVGALVGLAATYFLTGGVAEASRRENDDPRWLSRNQIG